MTVLTECGELGRCRNVEEIWKKLLMKFVSERSGRDPKEPQETDREISDASKRHRRREPV